ncbi:hypothetical protein GQR60_02135 [Labilibaculum sp. A4]|uniref:hypothetical protein n=1 Tax=Labilibaculum euxinus TaxID=2686357 RepID=UPI000F617ECB|nr:hypothetical protein [Labilibaculum euxinus]MDQ1770653.1 hypothetical protein [Labilibaculum euxinus]MWN75127.1 hypothetical protein [Labilibaculum euxinus]
MKRTSTILIFIALLTLVSFKSSWVKNIEILTEKIKKESILVDQFEDIKNKDRYMKMELLKSGKYKLLKTEFFNRTTMQTKTEFYLRDSVFLEYKCSGLESRFETKSNSFYSIVFEVFYYFKNNQHGIVKEREIRIGSFKESNKARIKLKDKEFKTREMTEEDIIKLQGEYNSLSLLLK